MSGGLRTLSVVNISMAPFWKEEFVNSLNSGICVEGLEMRRMLSGHPIGEGVVAVFGGNVTAVIAGGDVKITGDTVGNAISITPVGTTGTKIKITGLFGTKVNNGT